MKATLMQQELSDDTATDADRLAEMARDIEQRDERIKALQRACVDKGRGIDHVGRCLQQALAELARRPPPVKPGWELSPPPECDCGDAMKPYANHIGDGWITWWECDCGEDLQTEIIWPFAGSSAWSTDWGHVGVEVI